MAEIRQLNILRWNLKSFSSNQPNLLQFLNSYSVNVTLFSETWLRAEYLACIDRYQVYCSDRADGYGGVAILVHSSPYSFLIPVNTAYSNTHVIGIRVADISFICIYNSPILSIDQLVCLLGTASEPIFLGDDFNVHYPS